MAKAQETVELNEGQGGAFGLVKTVTNVPKSGEKFSPALEAELAALRQQVANLEAENRRLYEQTFLLHEQLSNTNVHERERMHFISSLAHELRNPLTSIKGYVDLMLEGATGELNELQQEFLSTAGANSDKLARIINELLDVSKLERGQASFQPIMTDLRALVNQVVDDARPLFDAKNIHFTVNLPPISGNRRATIEVNADRERMTQSVRAVLANAGRYCNSGDIVTLDLYQDATRHQAIIAVSDTGPTIPAEELPNVFTKFWQPQDPAWHEKGNFGLGLAIAKAVVDMHDGDLQVTNRSEGGNLFTLTLPTVNRENEDDFVAQPTRAALVVSRDATFSEMAQRLLTEGGFQVIIVEKHEEVVSDTPAWQPDLIIEDGLLGLEENNKPNNGSSRVVNSVPTLHLSLSDVEQRALSSGALGILPWPASDANTLDYIMQAVTFELNPAEIEHFKNTQPILIVSPISETLRALDKLLREAGHAKVYRATREYDALTLARRHRPALLLVDITSANGTADITLLEDLREDPLLQNTPVVVFTPAQTISQTPSSNYRPSQTKRKEHKNAGDKAVSGKVDKNSVAVYTNFVPKPFLKKRFLVLAQRLATGYN